MLCKEADIPVGRVTNNGHAWNAIQLDGKWYYVDCTWDDPSGTAQKVSGSERHTYFCLSSALLALDHPTPWTWALSSAQACNSLDANYFVYTGEWKQWGDYGWDYSTGNYTVNTLSGQIQGSFDNGETKHTIDWNSRKDNSGNIWLWYMESGSLKYVLITDREKAIVNYTLPKETFSLDGESVRIGVETTPAVMTVKITGWNIKEAGTLKLPANLKSVPSEAFLNAAATTLEIGSGCTEIGARAFANSRIRLVSVPSSVTKIEPDAFSGCGKIMFKTANSYAVQYAAKHGMPVIDP